MFNHKIDFITILIILFITMQQVYLDDLVEGETYYIQTVTGKYKAVYDKYDSRYYCFKDIICLKKNMWGWSGFINIYEYMAYRVFKVNKHSIQAQMEQRALSKILTLVSGQDGL